MLKNNKDNKTLEIIIWGIATLALSLFFVSLVGTKSLLMLMPLSIITSPLIAVIATKYNEVPTLVVLFVIFAATWVVSSLPIALIEIVSLGIIGMAVGYAFRNELNLKQLMIFGGVAYIIEFILINLIAIKFYKINFVQDVLVNGIVIPLMNLSVQQFKDSKEQIFQLINSVLINIPAIITISSFILGFVIVIVSLFITRKAGYNVNSVEPFSEFRLSTGTVWVSIATQVLSMGNVEGRDIDILTMVFLNISYVLNFFFMVQGIALVDFFFRKLGLHVSLRLIVYFMGGIIIAPFIFIPILPFVLTIAGVLDVLMDFRKLEIR